jgi:hypothetical protein
MYPATIQLAKDSSTNSFIPKAFYSIGADQYSVDARYPLLSYRSGESVEIIVEHEHPEKASVYRFWGYWITWGELLTSVIMAVLLYQIAVSITSNPSADALHEQLSYKEEKKTKYD